MAGPGLRPRLGPRGIAFASMVGTSIEWYDFYVYGTSVVLVLGPLFFPADDPLTSTLLGFSTFGVGFLARPVGAVVLSHFGDRVGRKHALVASLLLMGGATTAVGLLPTYHQVGLAAPALLVLLRLVQGFAVGGEWGGAVLLAVEHAPPDRRTRYGAFPQYGTPLGILFSSLAILLARLLPEPSFLAWGWRLPFLVSGVLVAVGLWARLRLYDAEEFLAVRRAGATLRRPVAVVLRRHWRAVVLGTALTLVTHATYIVSTFLPGYAKSSLGVGDGAALTALLVGSLVSLPVLALAARWGEHHDRHLLAGIGALLCAAWIYPAFMLTEAIGGIGLVVGVTIGFAVMMVQYAVLAPLLADQFPVAVRCTGISLSFQFSAVIGGGLMPLLASALVGRAGGDYAPAAALLVLAGLVTCAGAVVSARRVAFAEQREVAGA